MKTDPPSLWHNRSFMLLWGGQVVSTLGSATASLVYPLLILAITHSPAAAGFAGALRAIPYLLFSLPVGALIDRWDRRRVMVLCDVGRGVAVASIPVAMLSGMLTLTHIYLVAFVEGSLFVFFNLAEVAALPRVVPASQLPQAAAHNEAAFGAASIAGTSLGPLLYQTLGGAVPFIADALSYAASAVSLLLIRTPFSTPRAPTQKDLRAQIAEGLGWLWRQPLIRYMALLTGGLNFIIAALTLTIIVLAKAMGASDAEIGIVFSVGGIGGVVGSLVGGRLQRRFSFGRIIIGIVWLQSLLFPLYAIMPNFLLLGLVSALLFSMSPVYNIVQFSYRLALIPDALQGRVNSTFRLLAFGCNPLGAALSGILIERYGAVPMIGGLCALSLVLALLTTLNPHVRNAPSIEHAHAAAALAEATA